MNPTVQVVVIQGVTILVPAIVIYSWFTALGNIPADRLENASGWTVQLDSFLLAGFAIGLFWFWEKSSKIFRAASLPTHFRSVPLGLLLSPFVWFSLSGFLAIGCILTANATYLELSFWLTVYGITSAFTMWITSYSAMRLVTEAQSSTDKKKGDNGTRLS